MNQQDGLVKRDEKGRVLPGQRLNPRGVGGRTLAAALANWGKKPPSKKYDGEAKSNLDAVAESLFHRATVDRDVHAIKVLLDRILGPVPQRLEVAQLTDEQVLAALDNIVRTREALEADATDLDP